MGTLASKLIKKYYAPVPVTASKIQAGFPGAVSDGSARAVQPITTDPMATNITSIAPITQPQVAQPRAVNPIITDPLATSVTSIVAPPAQQPQVANQVTTDPLAAATVTPIVAPPAQVQTPAATQTPAAQPSLFGNTAPGIGNAYTSTLQDALTGKIYDPFAAGQKEAMARSEANSRASTASQIAGSGFSGQGIGNQIASGAEGEIQRNRFSTLNDIEKARNEGRVNALGEARAYGGAEEDIRQYEKNFGESARQYNQNLTEEQRQFDTGQNNWQKSFDQQKKEYGDSQAWTAYEQALATGSDADVIAAYKTATGKDLDPMAVSQYRGYYRQGQEQGLAAGDVAIKTAQATLDTMKRTDAGTALSSYLTTHLDANASDPAVSGMLQKYWESIGNSGPMPKDWADQQIKAARDVRLNTENGAFNYQVDQQVADGIYTKEQGDLLKTFNSSQLINFLVKDPTTGGVTFDTAAYLKSVDGTSSTTTTVPEGVNTGDSFVKDGKVYRATSATGSEVVTPDPDDAWAPENSQILAAGESGNPEYKTILDKRYKEVTDDGKLLTTPGKWGDLKKNDKIKDLSFDDPLIQRLKKELEANSHTGSYSSRGNTPDYFYIVKDGNSWKYVVSKDANFKG